MKMNYEVYPLLSPILHITIFSLGGKNRFKFLQQDIQQEMYCKCSYIYYATSEWISWVRVKKNMYAGKYQQFYVNRVTLILSYQISIENIYDQVDKFPLKLVCRIVCFPAQSRSYSQSCQSPSFGLVYLKVSSSSFLEGTEYKILDLLVY